jgi:uncharacterized protein (DUF305 family)
MSSDVPGTSEIPETSEVTESSEVPETDARTTEPDPYPPAEAGPGATPAGAGRSRWLVALLAAVCALALLAAGGAVAVIGGIGREAAPAEDSVDAGFARDMMVHHQQAVVMAGWVRDHGTNPDVRLIGYDIETQQLTEVGLFKGWLDGWGQLANTDREPMSWMSGGHVHLQAGRLMPGMATIADLARLRSLSGTDLDTFFLQLMIRHHQGGIPMARYAADHASTDYVRTAARKMADAQSIDIVNMEKLLRTLGGTPLPPPG